VSQAYLRRPPPACTMPYTCNSIANSTALQGDRQQYASESQSVSQAYLRRPPPACTITCTCNSIAHSTASQGDRQHCASALRSLSQAHLCRLPPAFTITHTYNSELLPQLHCKLTGDSTRASRSPNPGLPVQSTLTIIHTCNSIAESTAFICIAG
jgi:hypothetical protein